MREEITESEEKRTFSLPLSLIEQMEREAFWDRKTQKEVIVAILEEHYRNKQYEALPATYKKPKVGKPKKNR